MNIDSLIDTCIDNLADEDMKKGGESLAELAHFWARAGLDMRSFLDMRTYIINEAAKRTDALFIEEKLKLLERELQQKRVLTRH